MYKCECGGKRFKTVKKNEAYHCWKCGKVAKHEKIETELEKAIREKNEKDAAAKAEAEAKAAAAKAAEEAAAKAAAEKAAADEAAAKAAAEKAAEPVAEPAAEVTAVKQE
jgi:hypothetical protein